MRLITPTPETWDNYLIKNELGHFLQSWAWGEFQEKLGNKIWRLVVEDNGQIITQLLVIKLSLGFGQSILYSPRGQLINKNRSLTATQAGIALLLQEIKKIATQEKVVCFRIDPPAPADDLTTERFYASSGFVKNPKSIQPLHSLILDLHPTPEQLLATMKTKTRYNIHIAEKHGITATKSDHPYDFDKFLELTRATSGRQGFASHSENYYRTQFNVLHTANLQDLWVARHQDKAIAAILVNYFGDTATYVHGASDHSQHELMAPHLLQFAAIQDARRRGFARYDFWGINPDPNHPWAGFTRFKRGFGGTEIKYIGTLELPINPLLYKLYRLVSRLH
ncbi:MAG: peptidoglycan bridge formation glycyltransferase FemA/FemB family protein [Patescibacteria group bacterium]